MKLLIITAITEFEKDIKTLLKKANVKTFSYRNVMGYKDVSQEFIETNWFASEMNETESLLFYAFVKKENVDLFFQLIADFNAKQETKAQVDVAVLQIEKSN
ncbi:hypothetical protein IVB69_01110 [Flavobacterium sp. J49]|uniref:hypothetical protein n=1 Tax=Flavobacterium sp. J49 TaxID=2718534 RepID=UPI0015938D24|nr:hypothetical protein [Flavobacterium sp. J49]MBF6640067.1 hypothetical protein [Flavobacterium sp. J49]NIC01312.1 hypothetical protein [Flavobacterium sp. J49]